MITSLISLILLLVESLVAGCYSVSS